MGILEYPRGSSPPNWVATFSSNLFHLPPTLTIFGVELHPSLSRSLIQCDFGRQMIEDMVGIRSSEQQERYIYAQRVVFQQRICHSNKTERHILIVGFIYQIVLVSYERIVSQRRGEGAERNKYLNPFQNNFLFFLLYLFKFSRFIVDVTKELIHSVY